MTSDQPILEARGVHKTYRLGRVAVPVLRGADIAVSEGEWVAILGASGSGKSTLLHLLGGLDTPDKAKGEIFYRGDPLARADRDAYRSRDVGFVFQFYHLLPELSVLENVLIGAMIDKGRFAYAKARSGLEEHARDTLTTLGLGERLRHRPAELSGGERQRVAIARALINNPPVLLADEPTGNLDRATGDAVLESLTALRAQRGITMVMVTHDDHIARQADRVVKLEDGRVLTPDRAVPATEG